MKRIKLYSLVTGLIVLSLTLLSLGKTYALEVPATPISTYIVDNAEILSDQEESQLNTQIQQFRNDSSNELAILTVKDGEGIDPAQFATEVGREWGVGTKESKNGVVIFISLQNPKRIQIAVSTGLEGVLTDAQSGTISRNEIAPRFKESKYYEGLSAGVLAISQVTKGEYSSKDVSVEQNVKGGLWAFILAFVFLQFIFSLVTTTKSWWFGGLLALSMSGLLGLIAHSWMIGLVLAAILTPIGLLIDRLLSKSYQKHSQKRKEDKNHHFPWYFGGGGGFGSGSGSSGGFSGGGFSGGGSFGGGGGGSSW